MRRGDGAILAVVALAVVGAVIVLNIRRRTPAGTVTVQDLNIPTGGVEEVTINLSRLGGQGALPRGIRNNNPGNIRTLPASRAWRGQIGDDGGGYGVYDRPENGVRALGKQLLKYAAEGLNTVAAIINRWAPPVENATAAYVSAVARALSVGVNEPIDVHARLPELAAAIIRHENGMQPYTMAEIREWVYLP